jgi:hypothetical protein
MKKIIFTLSLLACFFTANTQTLVNAEFIDNLTELEIQNQYGVPGFLMNNGVNIYKVTYNTPDIDGNPSVASGLVAIPDTDSRHPLLCYQHGTVGSREEVPSNLAGDPLGVVFASFGYVTSSADYLGLGDSPGTHPYVHAATEASAAIDLLFATQELLEQNDQTVKLNDQLFITGYSQGGHAAAAVHREIQENYADVFTVTASAPMSGPYSMSGAMRDLILDDTEYFSTAYIPNTMLSFNAVYDIYDSTEDVFKAEYVEQVDLFAAEEITLWELETELQALLQANEGGSFPKRMLQDTMVAAIESNPNHPVNLALADNDVFDWAPNAPTRLYYCMGDDQVPFMNSVIAGEAMNAAGAPDLEAINLNDNFTHGQCIPPAIQATRAFFLQFQEITGTRNEFKELVNVSISPNPTTDFLQVNWISNEHTSGNITLYNIAGKVLTAVKAQPNGANTIDVRNFAEGLYWIVTETEGKKDVQSVVVSRR